MKKFIIELEGEEIPDLIFLGTAIDDFLKQEEYNCKFTLKELKEND